MLVFQESRFNSNVAEIQKEYVHIEVKVTIPSCEAHLLHLKRLNQPSLQSVDTKPISCYVLEVHVPAIVALGFFTAARFAAQFLDSFLRL